MPGALRPSLDLSQKSNVIPSINRRTEATAEDFKELSDIANNHATILDELTQAEQRNLFYGIFGSVELLEAVFENPQEGGYAIIDPQNGLQKVAKYINGIWVINEIYAPIIFLPSILNRPEVGQEQVWYVVEDSNTLYLWFGGQWRGFNGGANAELISLDNSIKVTGNNIEVNVDDWDPIAAFNNQINF